MVLGKHAGILACKERHKRISIDPGLLKGVGVFIKSYEKFNIKLMWKYCFKARYGAGSSLECSGKALVSDIIITSHKCAFKNSVTIQQQNILALTSLFYTKNYSGLCGIKFYRAVPTDTE